MEICLFNLGCNAVRFGLLKGRATTLVCALLAMPLICHGHSAPATTAVTRLPAASPEATAPANAATAPVASQAQQAQQAAGAAGAERLDERLMRQPRNAVLADETVPDLSEFERLATQANGGQPVQRLGARTRRVDTGLSDRELPARVPPGYVLQVGDEISVSIWGSLDAQWLFRVDRAGRINLPRVGPVAVAGETAGGLEARLSARLGKVFKSFELAAAVTDISPMRVHITGFVERPGDFIVPGLTTVSGALNLAQGPSAGGSYRRIRLERDELTVVVFDMYSLMREGKRRDDQLLQPGDVLFVEPVGPQVAVLGSVNRVAVFEFLAGETVADVLRLAGGFSSVADRSKVVVERLRERSSQGAMELSLPRDEGNPLTDGDILRVKSQTLAALPSQLRNKRVLVEGEVRNPGEYLLPAQATLVDAVEAAGGATPAAFLFGTSLRRDSVRITQEVNYERALRELEDELTRSAADRNARSDASGDAQIAAQQLLARLRTRRPDGRMVLEVTPESTTLPAIALEDGDRIQLPPSNQSVGVFGSVSNAGSFSHAQGRDLGHYIRRAGGPTAGADYALAFVVRANGSVLSAGQREGWWRNMQPFESEAALPGDTVFVPQDLFRGNVVQGFKDWTQILYQLSLGLAGIRVLR